MAKVNTLDRTAYYNYMKLDMGDKVLATYIWIDGTGQVSEEIVDILLISVRLNAQ